ncbi:MAG: CDP-alcohol phosphatidyltransferase family protein, partial [Candidatus Eisenbacteria bacterium]
ADGFLARRTNATSKLGYILDPVGDILFNLGLTVTLSARGVLPTWVGAVAFVRYARLLLGAAWFLGRRGELRVGPTRLGKATGLVIGMSLFAILLDLASTDTVGAVARVARTVLGLAFGVGVIQAGQLGWDRLRRPDIGDEARYRRGGELWSKGSGTPDEPSS